MRLIIPMIAGLAAALAGCGEGGERVSIRGDFADTAAVPTSVFAVEAGREVEVRRGAFDLRDLSAGPVTLRLVRGVDTVGSVALQVPAGTRMVLHGLRTDGPTRRAFPRTLALEGPPVLLVNGIRMAADGAVPAAVHQRGTVLAASEDGAALLVRPTDAALPDLRVVVGLGTETIAPDSTPVEPTAIGRGDSVRVEGRPDGAFVVASRITVLRGGDERVATTPPPAPPAESDRGGGDESASGESTTSAPVRSSASPSASSVPVRVPREVRARVSPIERPRGGGRGRGGGGGRGHGKKG